MKEKPDLICVNVTFLNRIVEHVALEEYSFVARRDISDGVLNEGIAAFAVSAIAERIIVIESSDDANRFWFMVHVAQGPHLVGVWYKPPAPGETAMINAFETELRVLEGISLGTFVQVDIKVHNAQLLRHSKANSVAGTALKAPCDEAGLQQIMTTPAQQGHLLDLVFTNIPGARVSVLPAMTNHKIVKAELTFEVPEQSTVTRMVWQFAKSG